MTDSPNLTHEEATTWWYCECGEPLNGRLARDHECEATRRARGDGEVGDG